MQFLICQHSNSGTANGFRSNDDGTASFDGWTHWQHQVMREFSLAEIHAAGEKIREALCLIVWSGASQYE